MKREEYLNELRKNLNALTIEEQNEALEYYASYFEDANDDEHVIEELGSPENLAKIIEEKFANALSRCQKSEGKDDEKSKKNNDTPYFECKSELVKNLLLDFSFSQVVVISGEKYSVETRGIDSDSLNCSLTKDGSLIIKNTKKINLGFWKNHKFGEPKILITIPKNCKLNQFSLSVGGGSVKSKEISLYCDSGFLNLGSGNVCINSIYGGKMDFHVGMGNFTYTGTVSKNTNINCGMGNLKLNLFGNEKDYSYNVNVGLGKFEFNNQKQSGVYQFSDGNKKENHLSINVGMGNVNIQFGEQK